MNILVIMKKMYFYTVNRILSDLVKDSLSSKKRIFLVVNSGSLWFKNDCKWVIIKISRQKIAIFK